MGSTRSDQGYLKRRGNTAAHHTAPLTVPPHSSHTQSLHRAPPTLPMQLYTTQLPHMYTQVNVKPDEEEHTNLNIGTHNIAIGGTLG